MIDLHTHLLPEIDDGAKSMEEAVQIIEQGVKSGITGICVTPHIPVDFKKEKTETIMENFSKLQEKISEKKVVVDLYLGSEIDLRTDFDSIRELPFFFINQTQKYLFVELPIAEFPAFVERALFTLLVEGISPILAHPERSLDKEADFRRVEKLKDSGVLIQSNAGSLSGDFGRKIQKTARRLLQDDLVDFFSSDAHDLNSRPITVMTEAYKMVKKESGEEKALKLFQEIPQKILQAETIETKVESKYF